MHSDMLRSACKRQVRGFSKLVAVCRSATCAGGGHGDGNMLGLFVRSAQAFSSRANFEAGAINPCGYDDQTRSTVGDLDRDSAANQRPSTGRQSKDMRPHRGISRGTMKRESELAARPHSLNGAVLTHVDDSGRASMVDVGDKSYTTRVAMASARVSIGERAFGLVSENRSSKGDILTVAKIAGINAAKQTHALIPLCHQLLLRKVSVDLTLSPRDFCVDIRATAKTEGQTGVEMEALVAASVAGLTVYDMCKAVSKDIIVSDIRLEMKTGGKSGDYVREN